MWKKCVTMKALLAIHLIFSCLKVAATVELPGGSTSPEPGFVGVMKNVTAPEGRDVVLQCTVKNLDGHRVAWIHYDKSAILTVQNHVITRNPRIRITHESHKTWNLHILDVQRSDQGAYMCQINTSKAKTRLSYLTVVVPPRIEDNLSSGDKVRTEGSNVTLECSATGSPSPSVTWKREDGQPISIDKSNNATAPTVEGSILKLYKVSRLDMGAYMCIAANGIPPAVSKRIQLGIDFPPMMWVPAQKISAMKGSQVKFVCYVEAHPEALTYWQHNGRMMQQTSKISIRNHIGTPRYKVEMELIVSNVEDGDFGTYNCIAKNPRGQTDGEITLTEEIPLSTTSVETSTTTSTTDFTVHFFDHTDQWQYQDKEKAYGARLNELDTDEERKEYTSKDEQDQKQRHFTTTRYDSDSLYGENSQPRIQSCWHFVLQILLVLHEFRHDILFLL